MSRILIDNNTLFDFKEKWVLNIKLYFYDAWCSWTKVDIEENPDISNLTYLEESNWINIYCDNQNKDKFDNCIITRTITSDHTWKNKTRYIFTSNKVKDRCWCWSSFSFEKKQLKIDLNKLKDMKFNFKK